MPKIRLIPYDVVDYLKTPQQMALYLGATVEEFGHDTRAILQSIGDIARAQGMTAVARRSGLGRESLYKALAGDGNPSFDTVLRVLDALGLRLTVAVDDDPAIKKAQRANARGSRRRVAPLR
jgi:probable addiction module antidote protein